MSLAVMDFTTPIAGPQFRIAARLRIKGEKRRKLLCLLAAYADAGEHSPRMNDLATRLELPISKIDHLLFSLQRQGWLTVEWAAKKNRGGHRGTGGRRNVYTLHLEGGDERH